MQAGWTADDFWDAIAGIIMMHEIAVYSLAD